MRIAHIINPVGNLPASSDLTIAQPITLETMRRARAYATTEVEVDLFTAQFPEDHGAVPADFQKTPDLDRSVLDFGDFQKKRKLPLLRDILSRLYEKSDAEFFVYTNLDIALLPHFYLGVAALLRRGADSLIINRRTISKEWTETEDLPLMYAQVGEKHPGRDCFVWRRDVLPQFHMEHACIGTGGVGKVMLVNQVATATRFQEIADFHLTFHLGDDRRWQADGPNDLLEYNQKELRKVVEFFRSRNALPEHPLIAKFIKNKGL